MGFPAVADSNSAGRPKSAHAAQTSLSLSLAEMKDLCVVLAADMDLVVAETRPYQSHLDVFFTCKVLLHSRQVLIRLTTDQVSIVSLREASEEARRRDCADYLIVTTQPPEHEGLAGSNHVLGPAAFDTLLRSSHAVAWIDERPKARRDAYVRARRRAQRLHESDRLGLAWLPPLSRFKHPWQLRESPVQADEWFERMVFQLATSIFRLSGVRLGTAKRGQRVGDALLWKGGEFILLDCKAAHDGYRLGVDDERRLLEYAMKSYPEYGFARRPRCVVLVSSTFPVFDSQPYRFVERRRRFIEVGSDLACIRADDLVEAAMTALENAGDTRAVDNIAWCDLLAEGMVTRQSLIECCGAPAGSS